MVRSRVPCRPQTEVPPIPHPSAADRTRPTRPARGGRMAAALGATGLALILAACGGRFAAGATPSVPTPRPTRVVATPTPSPTACTTPAAAATISLPGARTLPDGLEILDRKVGTGPVAKVGSKLSVLYVGSLPNGTIFDASSRHGNRPFSFTLGKHQVISGWDQGLVGMRQGGVRELVIPAALGYGCASPGAGIPANSTLIFTVTLVKVV